MERILKANINRVKRRGRGNSTGWMEVHMKDSSKTMLFTGKESTHGPTENTTTENGFKA